MAARWVALGLLALSACGAPAPSGAADPGGPGSGATCERTCNASYDSCMDRFSGIGPAGGLVSRSDAESSSTGPNDVCPEQLKSCLRNCLN